MCLWPVQRLEQTAGVALFKSFDLVCSLPLTAFFRLNTRLLWLLFVATGQSPEISVHRILLRGVFDQRLSYCASIFAPFGSTRLLSSNRHLSRQFQFEFNYSLKCSAISLNGDLHLPEISNFESAGFSSWNLAQRARVLRSGCSFCQ